MLIGIVNESTLAEDHDVHLMTRAVAHQMRYDVSPAWDKHPPAVIYYSDVSHVPPGAYVIGVFDNDDQAGVLGWHTESSDGSVFGRVFVKPTLDAGGDMLHGELSVASVLSHEVAEAFVDPNVQMWAADFNGKLYALEVCDPVESDYYMVRVGDQQVSVSNFVFPAWFDPQAPPTARLDYVGTTSKPFTMAPGGYVIYSSQGQEQAVFGENYPEWKRQTKETALARSARRISPGALGN